MEKPTQEEIERVEAWRRQQRDASHAEWRRKQEEREKQALLELSTKLAGRYIIKVDGEQDGSDWSELSLKLSGDVTLTIKVESWTGEPDLDIEVKGV